MIPQVSSCGGHTPTVQCLLPSPFKFERHGKSGLPISELFPHVAKHADDLCLLNSMYTEVPNHPQSCLMLHTGEFRFTRSSSLAVAPLVGWLGQNGSHLCNDLNNRVPERVIAWADAFPNRLAQYPELTAK